MTKIVFSSDLNEKILCYESDDFRKKKNLKLKKNKIRWKNVRKILDIFFCRNFFFMGGCFDPRTPTGAAPLDPTCFWIEDSSGKRFELNGISAKNKYFFHRIFFFLTLNFFSLKIVWIGSTDRTRKNPNLSNTMPRGPIHKF